MRLPAVRPNDYFRNFWSADQPVQLLLFLLTLSPVLSAFLPKLVTLRQERLQ